MRIVSAPACIFLVLGALPLPCLGQPRSDIKLQQEFNAALPQNDEEAKRYLMLAADRPWLGQANFGDACALAANVEYELPREAEKLVTAAGLRNPALGLREAGQYLGLTFGRRVFDRIAREAPDEAVAVAAGTTKTAILVRDALAASDSPELQTLARFAEDRAIDLPTRQRMAHLAGLVSSTPPGVMRLARDTARYFGTLVDARLTATPEDAARLGRALENESRVLCQAVTESGAKSLPRELSEFRARDLYVLLALGRTEGGDAVFGAIFDRLLLPRLRAERPAAASLLQFLDATGNWELRDFAAGAVAARRLEPFRQMVGAAVLTKLAAGIDREADPPKEAVRVAEVIAATSDTGLLDGLAAVVLSEFARCSGPGKENARLLYGLLAARLSQIPPAKPALKEAGSTYLPYLVSSETIDTSVLCGEKNECLQRYFFYDDDDGVQSFESFRKTYERDAAWAIDDQDSYVRISAKGPTGRRIEIFANRPIDAHLAANRARQGEAERRQRIIAELLENRNASPPMMVHRGHSFYTASTVRHVTPAVRLVILGSCGGVSDIHGVIEASHEAQVIATRGVGTTQINDALLKNLNDLLLSGTNVVDWSTFWREQSARLGRHAMFRDYVAPNQETLAVFLRAYYRLLDAEELQMPGG